MKATALAQESVIGTLMTSFHIFMTSLQLTLLVMTQFPDEARVRAVTLPSDQSCQFPEFLQTSVNRPWMMKQAKTITTFDVQGGTISARSASCVKWSRGSQRPRLISSPDCVRFMYTRQCMEERPGGKFLVRHVESDFGDKFVCLQFLKRGPSVVQVKMSLILGSPHVDALCGESYMHVDPWPWISEEHYRSAHVDFPFTGGYNLLMKYSSPLPQAYYDGYGTASNGIPEVCTDTSTSPIRMENDCVAREGIVFTFKHKLCLPAGTRLSLRQRVIAMASWTEGNDLFAMVRAYNAGKTFYCLRVRLKVSHQDDVADNPDADYYPIQEDNNAAEIDEVVLFLAWVCPTRTYEENVRRYSTPRLRGYSDIDPHMTFIVKDQRVISQPCSDELATCHNHTSFCRHLHCMKTCGQCLTDPSSASHFGLRESSRAVEAGDDGGRSPVDKKAYLPGGRYLYGDGRSEASGVDREDSESMYRVGETRREGGRGDEGERERAETEPTSKNKPSFQRKCTFPDSMQGTWLQRNPDGSDVKLVVTESAFDHPRYGLFHCVTFTPPGSEATPLRRVLWSHYDNGCYPRFTCLHYNTPAKGVMRYRLANIQHWPLLLSDDDICAEKNFMQLADMSQPTDPDKYAQRSWEVVRRAGTTHGVACILPHYLPKVISFRDHVGRSGCLVHGTYYSPRAIILAYFPGTPLSSTGQAGQSSIERPTVSVSASRNGGGQYNRDVTNRKQGGSDDVSFGGSEFQTVDYRRGADISGYGNGGSGGSGRNSYRAYSRDGYRSPYSGSDVSPSQWSEKLRPSYHDDGSEENGGNPYVIAARPAGRHSSPDYNETFLFMKTNKHAKPGDDDRFLYGTYPAHGNVNERYLRQRDGFDYNNNDDENEDFGQRRTVRALWGQRTNNDRHSLRHRRGKTVDRYRRRLARSRRREDDNKVVVESGSQTSYDCLAVMTYVDSYKSVLTETAGEPSEILCWLVVNETTIVIVKTSSCNSQTAQRVLQSQLDSALHKMHVHKILHLHQGDRDCNALFPTNPVRPELSEFREPDKSLSGARSSRSVQSCCSVIWLVLSLEMIVCFLLDR